MLVRPVRHIQPGRFDTRRFPLGRSPGRALAPNMLTAGTTRASIPLMHMSGHVRFCQREYTFSGLEIDGR